MRRWITGTQMRIILDGEDETTLNMQMMSMRMLMGYNEDDEEYADAHE